jgi:3-hydroxyisobutyrate dehydrogenase
MTQPEQPRERAMVAIIGTGIMGSAMARRLIASGFRGVVWDRSRSALEPLVEAGAVAASSAVEAVRGTKVVITMLPTADIVSSVMLDGGVVDAMAPGAVWAQMGTIGVEATRDMRDRMATRRPDVLFVDAPVSGTRGPAEQGQLAILASGPSGASRIVDPVFSAIGRKTVWLGEAGKGSQMKLVVNAYMLVVIEGIAEAMALADDWDISHADLAQVIEGGPLAAPYVLAKLHKMDERDYTAEFPLEWALKDVDLAIGAEKPGALPALTALSREMHVAVEQGHGREDVSAVRLALAGKA